MKKTLFVHGYRSEENSQHIGPCPLEQVIEYELVKRRMKIL